MKKILIVFVTLAILIIGRTYHEKIAVQKNDTAQDIPDTAALEEESENKKDQDKNNISEIDENHPLFITIPKDWFDRNIYKNYKHTSPTHVKLKGTLSWFPNAFRSGDIYFTPDGGAAADEIRIVCDRYSYSLLCYDEPTNEVYDDQGLPIGVGIRNELKMLIDDTKEKDKKNPHVIIDGTIVECYDQRLGKVSFAATDNMNIFLIDAFVSDRNKKSREMRLASAK